MDSSPLLNRSSSSSSGIGKSCARIMFGWIPVLGWFFTPHIPSNAETVILLQTVMTDIKLAMDHAEEKEKKKKTLAAEMLTKGYKEEAMKAWQTSQSHRRRFKHWFNMRENVEQIKDEIVSQQQSVAVFGAFNEANTALGRIAETLNVDTLNKVLDDLHEKFQEGNEVSEMLANPDGLDPSSAVFDEDEMRRDLEDFLGSSKTQVEITRTEIPKKTKVFEEKRGSAKTLEISL